jgi:transposase
MLGLSSTMAVYVHRLPIDFRKSINGLAALVEHELRLDPFADACYVFSNKRHDKVKILVWQRNGFWLCYKRLEARDRFVWPRADEVVVSLSQQQLQWLLAGVDLRAVRPHPERRYRHAS